MQTIHDSLSNLTVGAPVYFRGLTMFPLIREDDRAPEYLTLDEALESGTVRITEVSEGGRVPELRLENEGNQPVFLLDGEELVGCKQNRVLNLSILAPAGKSFDIPVSCVERGRWSYDSPEFRAAPRAMNSRGRAQKMAQVSASLMECRVARSDQGAVWRDVENLACSLGGGSATDALGSIFESRDTDLGEYAEHFKPFPKQVGALFSINGHAHGLDLFDTSATLEKYLPKLVRSHALDAIRARTQEETEQQASADASRAFLDALRTVAGHTYPAAGLGEDVRIESPELAGAALIEGGRTVHLCAFNVEANSDAEASGGDHHSRIRRASVRRTNLRRDPSQS